MPQSEYSDFLSSTDAMDRYLLRLRDVYSEISSISEHLVGVSASIKETNKKVSEKNISDDVKGFLSACDSFDIVMPAFTACKLAEEGLALISLIRTRLECIHAIIENTNDLENSNKFEEIKNVIDREEPELNEILKKLAQYRSSSILLKIIKSYFLSNQISKMGDVVSKKLN